MPLLIGANHDEMRSFVLREAALTGPEYRTKLVETFGDRVDTVLAEYPAADYDRPALALARVLTDWGGSIGACPVLRTVQAAAGHQPVYAYEFNEDSGLVIDGYPMGAFHGLELSYLWELNLAQNPYPPLDAAQQRLSATMVEYWTAFVRTGDPNGAGRPLWSEFGRTGTVLGLSTGAVAPVPFAADHHCDFWASGM